MKHKHGKSKTGQQASDKIKRREEAEIRNYNWNCLSPRVQLQALDLRLGKGIGATKQRRILAEYV